MTRGSSALQRATDKSKARATKVAAEPQLSVATNSDALPAAPTLPGPAGKAKATGNGRASREEADAPLSIGLDLDRKPELGRVAIELIDIASDRMADLDEAWVEVIAQTYGQVGQMQPIRLVREPNGRFTLDGFGFGVSRVHAARLKGWTEIDAVWIDRDQADPRFYRLPEIVENIARRTLCALDEAQYLAEYKAIYERAFPSAKKGGNHKLKQSFNQRENISLSSGHDQNEIISFRSHAGEQTGLTPRAITMKVAMWHGLEPQVRLRLRGTPLASNQAALRAISVLEPTLQAKVCELLLATPSRVATVADAVLIAQGKRLALPSEKMFRSVQGGLARLGSKDRTPIWQFYEDEIIADLKARGRI